MTAGKSSEKHHNGVEKIREAYEKVVREESGRLGVVQELLSLFCPHCNSFSLGGLHLVGFDLTRRQQQQEKETLQLVVRGVWRQMWHPVGSW